MEQAVHSLVHIHMVGRAFVNRPPETTEETDKWLSELVEKIDMKVLMGPYTIDCKTFGNEGITGAIVLETSHASVHFWTHVERPFLMFDVYSCAPYRAATVIEHIHDYFDIADVEYVVMDRTDNFKIIEKKDLDN